MKHRKSCIRLAPARVKLLYKHEDVVAGTIEHLGYDAYGRLKIRCRVSLSGHGVVADFRLVRG